MSVFEQLNSVNVNDKTEKKGKLTYLSWAWAWGEVKKAYPDATYTIYERQTEYGPVNYFTDGRTCWVKTGVTIEGLEHIEELPVMNNYNNPIPYESVTSTDVNKSIQRSITKACARHGLGLYIYAGEDLPETDATAGATPVESVSIEHPKASAPATVTVQTPTLSKTDIEKLTQNAKYVYGDEYASKLVELMAKYGFNRPEDVTITAYELIKAQMTKDMRAKKGAA